MRFVREQDLKAAAPSPDKFTAGVWQTDTLDALHEGGMRGVRFVYQPGAHSHWHTHTGEQAIVVLSGSGVVVREGETAGTPVGPGDWVHVEPGEMHWHGALPGTVFVHLAVIASGGTEWHGAVSDDEYAAGAGGEGG